ncbi:hybrid sensor histidine kinase/response regulator [Candidatus Aerophobetes bacterium]|uniref:histidine kinase n=1 Tax=Aerophobetes bacterium TaxID=2030807 RepID=A0A523WBK2_UNCAE|nr:MAG: hybrid sensor histidine kinase/response regulator [Candidatus Aerophobetes bacterium]
MVSETRSTIGRGYGTILLGLLILFGSYLTTLYSYLLFHSLVELFSIVVAFAIFMLAWNSRRFLDNNYLLFIGIAYFFIGGLDLIHTLAYKGMGVFLGYGSNLPTELWIAARYVESSSLLIASLILGRKLRPGFVFLGYAVGISLLLATIFYWDIFPQCFVEGVGLTPFKKVSEYVISLILIGSMIFLLRSRRQFDKGVLRLLVASIAITVGSELAFTFFVDLYGLSNLIGHLFKILSFYLIYKALIETGLRKPYDLLFRNLKQSEESLARSNTELGAINKELETFSYSVSHDLRVPLRAIDGFSSTLAEDYSSSLGKEGQGYLERVRAGVKNMNQLIEDLLNLSRIGRRPMNRKIASLEDVAKEAYQSLEEEWAKRKISFVVNPLPSVLVDPGLLRIVFTNFFSNALKFTRNRANAQIEVGSEIKDGEEIFFVKDNGVGFDMKYANKLFSPFQRLHSQEEYEGTGVGLATVRRIIHRHGGRIWAESKPDSGTTFYFTLQGNGVRGRET